MLKRKDTVKRCCTEKRARIGVRVCTKVCVKKMAQVKIKKMAQGKIARRLAFARLNAVRCGGGMTPFSHHTALRRDQSAPFTRCERGGAEVEEHVASARLTVWSVWQVQGLE